MEKTDQFPDRLGRGRGHHDVGGESCPDDPRVSLEGEQMTQKGVLATQLIVPSTHATILSPPTTNLLLLLKKFLSSLYPILTHLTQPLTLEFAVTWPMVLGT